MTQTAPSADQVGRLDLAYEAHRRGDREGALAILDPLLLETADLGRAWMLKGVVTDPADFALQLALFEQAVAASPGDAEAWHNLGVCLAYAGRWRHAAAATRRALAIDPVHPEALANACELERLMGDYEQAVALADRRLRLGEAPWEIHLRRGVCLIALGRPEEAELALQAAIARAPASVAAGDLVDLIRRGGANGPQDQLEAMIARLSAARRRPAGSLAESAAP